MPGSRMLVVLTFCSILQQWHICSINYRTELLQSSFCMQLSHKWIFNETSIFRGALYIDYNWRIVQRNTNVCVMLLFGLYVTKLFTFGSGGDVCFKGIVVTDIQVASCLLCKPRNEFYEDWEGRSFIWVTVPAFEHDGVPVLSADDEEE